MRSRRWAGVWWVSHAISPRFRHHKAPAKTPSLLLAGRKTSSSSAINSIQFDSIRVCAFLLAFLDRLSYGKGQERRIGSPEASRSFLHPDPTVASSVED